LDGNDGKPAPSQMDAGESKQGSDDTAGTARNVRTGADADAPADPPPSADTQPTAGKPKSADTQPSAGAHRSADTQPSAGAHRSADTQPSAGQPKSADTQPSAGQPLSADTQPSAGQALSADPPPIFDLPDGVAGDDDADPALAHEIGDRTLVLGGAAAAEGRTSGPLPRIGGPLPAEPRTPPGGSGGSGGNGTDGAGDDAHAGRHFQPSAAGDDGGPPRWALALAAVPVLALVLLIGAWAIDTAALSGQVQRNVEVAGRSVGGLGEESLPEVMASIAEEVAARPVRIVSDDKVYETTAGEIGLTLDEQATSDAALDVGRRDSLLTRPFTWLNAFFTPRDVDVRYTASGPTATAKMVELQGADLTKAQDATIQLSEQGWVLVPSVAGQGVDIDTLIEELPDAAARSRTGPIEVEVGSAPVAPAISDEQAQERADQANQMTANGLQLTAGETTKTVPPEQLRAWIGPTAEGGELDLTINADAVNQALPQVFADVANEVQDARIVLGANGPEVVPSEQGVACCGPDSAERVWGALSQGQPGAELEVTVTEPAFSTQAAEECGVTQPVGGNHAWQGGGPTTAGPGFTTFYVAGEVRVTNIHRIADLVDGSLVKPGETFSINERVGPRTADKGFVEAGAIRDGRHTEELGGGISQFSTTTFNAAFFAGLDIVEYQAHSEYFNRYPPGREATMGYPAPDMAFVNDTPHCILVDTSHTSDSVTVTLWSTPYATGEQVGISESMTGVCRNVTTTRRITYPDRPAATDTFQATYRPEGRRCDGSVIPPEPEP
jgi:vancomycin resistance protein YoaR